MTQREKLYAEIMEWMGSLRLKNGFPLDIGRQSWVLRKIKEIEELASDGDLRLCCGDKPQLKNASSEYPNALKYECSKCGMKTLPCYSAMSGKSTMETAAESWNMGAVRTDWSDHL